MSKSSSKIAKLEGFPLDKDYTEEKLKSLTERLRKPH